jgi:hypothetical protein
MATATITALPGTESTAAKDRTNPERQRRYRQNQKKTQKAVTAGDATQRNANRGPAVTPCGKPRSSAGSMSPRALSRYWQARSRSCRCITW